MVNRHRAESPGAWHHIINRGTARRTVFESRRDADEFFTCLQRVVDEGLLKVHAYYLMGTHSHHLTRSPIGGLSRAMMLVQNTYSRWFNRGRRRDGPLRRGRFLSKLIRSETYWQVLVRYIDFNPVKARIVDAHRAHHRELRALPKLQRIARADCRDRARKGRLMLAEGGLVRIVSSASRYQQAMRCQGVTLAPWRLTAAASSIPPAAQGASRHQPNDKTCQLSAFTPR